MRTKTVEAKSLPRMCHTVMPSTITHHVLMVPPGHLNPSLISDYRVYYCRSHLHVHTSLSNAPCLLHTLQPSTHRSLKITHSRGNAYCIFML